MRYALIMHCLNKPLGRSYLNALLYDTEAEAKEMAQKAFEQKHLDYPVVACYLIDRQGSTCVRLTYGEAQDERKNVKE